VQAFCQLAARLIDSTLSDASYCGRPTLFFHSVFGNCGNWVICCNVNGWKDRFLKAERLLPAGILLLHCKDAAL